MTFPNNEDDELAFKGDEELYYEDEINSPHYGTFIGDEPPGWMDDWYTSPVNPDNICKRIHTEIVTVFKRDGRYHIVFEGNYSDASYSTQRKAMQEAEEWVNAHPVGPDPADEITDNDELWDDADEL
jgi:hypothetical protein